MPIDPDAVLSDLNRAEDSFLTVVWPSGRNTESFDGRHFVANGTTRPVSVSQTEAFFLANLTYLSSAVTAVEIGTGFGYSGVWLTIGVARRSAGGQVLTLDNHSEGEAADEGAETAAKLVDATGLSNWISFYSGSSPAAVSAMVDNRLIDLAFIDGDHHGQQPLVDYQALAPYMAPDGLLLFHDNDEERYSVPYAIRAAEADGWNAVHLNTSCFLTVLHRTEGRADAIGQALAASEAHVLVSN